MVREDPVRPACSTPAPRRELYVSFDQGDSWQPLRANLPVVPVYDLEVKDDNLIAATHGRSFWILDDLTQLRQLGSGAGRSAHRLLQPRDTYRIRTPFRDRKPTLPARFYRAGLGADVTYSESLGPAGETVRKMWDAGENPPDGAMIHYYLQEAREEVTLTIQDGAGEIIRSFSSKPPGSGEDAGEPRAPAQSGMNRFVWNLRYPDAHKVPEDKTTEDAVIGPLASPGEYQVSLRAGEDVQTQTFRILKDPRVGATQEDFDAQFKFLIEIRDKVSETHDGINQLRGFASRWTSGLVAPRGMPRRKRWEMRPRR